MLLNMKYIISTAVMKFPNISAEKLREIKDENAALFAKLASSDKKTLEHTSNPPTISSALMLCFRICSAILSVCFAGSVLRE